MFDLLTAQLQRLYLVVPSGDEARGVEPALVDAAGQVRALVLGLTGVGGWSSLGAVWHGVQAELGLPAPAIAVAGDAGLQLWFSLANPEPMARIAHLADSLRRRWLSDLDAGRVIAWPPPAPAGTANSIETLSTPHLPAGPLVAGTRWSAFVAPDLAPVFADEPWLDMPPSDAGQAQLLAGLGSISAADIERVLRVLDGTTDASPSAAPEESQPSDNPALGCSCAAEAGRFLQQVMRDPTTPLAVRVEAAKALLWGGGPSGRPCKG